MPRVIVVTCHRLFGTSLCAIHRSCEVCSAALSLICLGAAFALLFASAAFAAEPSDDPVTLENVKNPGKNDPEEPLADEFSAAKAGRYLDTAAVNWQKFYNCMTCHTNYLYLMSRPSLSSDLPAHRTVRDYAEKLITDRWPAKGPRWDAEVVMTAAMLAGNDANDRQAPPAHQTGASIGCGRCRRGRRLRLVQELPLAAV